MLVCCRLVSLIVLLVVLLLMLRVLFDVVGVGVVIDGRVVVVRYCVMLLWLSSSVL